ncbi:hypothetical protein CPB86DRAFT_227086 [Serendipita vermifera]|nr:hypothetical protein CPB86DRAFT_227086 [Serendipita vermifera]
MFSLLKQLPLPFLRRKDRDLNATNPLVIPTAQTISPDEQLSTNNANRIFALVIGINEYSDRKWALEGAVADAKAMEDYLRACFPYSHIRSLCDQEATRRAIIQNIRDLATNPNIHRGDPILIYYAGHVGEAICPEDWASHGQSVQFLIPQDYNNDNTIITDIGLTKLLHQLASKKGDNIVVILDSCFPKSRSATSTRPIDTSRRLSDTVDEDILGIMRIRFAAVPECFQYNGVASHVVLISCGPGEMAIEEEGQGIFTRALLDTLKTVGYQNLTYTDLIQRLPRLERQNPRCEGFNRDRFLFSSRLLPGGGTFYDVQIETGDVIVRAGAAHGVTDGAEFTLFRSRDKNTPPLGTFPIKILKASTAILDRVDSTSIDLPVFALQTKVNTNDALRVHFTNKPGMYETRQMIIQEIDADNSAFEPCLFVDRDQAQVEVDVEDGRVVFKISNSPVSSLGLSRLPYRVKQQEREVVCNIIRAAAHFERYLNYTSKDSAMQKFIEVEFMRVERIARNIWEPLIPTKNLCEHNCVQVVADGTLYGIKITNNSMAGLYPHLFLFDCSDLSICECFLHGKRNIGQLNLPSAYYYRPPTVQNRDHGAPLQPNDGILTVGFGPGGERPWRYRLRDELECLGGKVSQERQDLEVSVFKLILTSEPIDLSFISQESPFTDDHRAVRKIKPITDLWDTVSFLVMAGRNQDALSFD